MPNFENIPTEQLKKIYESSKQELLKRVKCEETENILFAARMMSQFQIEDIIEQIGYGDKHKICEALKLSGYKNKAVWCPKTKKTIRRWMKNNNENNHI
jgi:hypothetical protein